MKVEISTLAAGQPDKEKHLIKAVLKPASRYLKIPPRTEISVVLLSASRMQKLNRAYRQKNHPTTTLSFCFRSPFSIKKAFGAQKKDFLGEIFLCLPEIRKFAHKNNLAYSWSVKYHALHSLLHLLDYSHSRKSEREKMETVSQKILKKENAVK
ncbi:MAG: rRNA maturation RNase YbeY [Patescibacteria group bacterium]|nr:rRNA maturation RNase YbeY [Patescibacteria group bacterium]